MEITINNQKIIDFFQKNKDINIEKFLEMNIDLENIQTEYLEFIKNKNDIINNLNLSIKNIKKIDLVSIKDILEKYNKQLPLINDICPECNKIFSSIASLSAHKKKHNNEKKKINKDKVIEF